MGSAGAVVRFERDRSRCQHFVNNVPSCARTQLADNNPCSNGVPLCAQRSNFDFTHVTVLPCTNR